MSDRNPFWLVGQDGMPGRVNNPPQVDNLPHKLILVTARSTGFSLCRLTDV